MGTPLELNRNNYHCIEVEQRELIFHIPSSALFELDSTGRKVIDFFEANGSGADYSALTAECADDELDNTIAELRSLDILRAPGTVEQAKPPIALKSVPLTTVVLNINTGCNLSCSYCYKEDLATPSNGIKMDYDTAIGSIEMLLKESPNQPRYNVVFFGGEPLSHLPLIKKVITYCEQRFGELGKLVDFSMTTNATLLNEQTIRYLDQHNVGIAVSIDGPKALHDKNRITVGGKGTYETVAKKVGLLLNNYRSRPVGARVTLTTGVTDIHTIWDHLFNELGFAEVGFAPVTSGDLPEYNLSNEELAAVFSNMKALGEKYLEAALRNENIGFSNLHQLLTDLHIGRKKTLPCGAGVGMVAVDHAGGVNLCHRFTGSDLPLFGDIKQGVDRPALNQFLNERVEKAEQGCNTCRIRNLCAGGCYHESYAKYNEPTKPTFHYCDLMRDWVDFGVSVYAQIMAQNPGFYDTHITPRGAQQ